MYFQWSCTVNKHISIANLVHKDQLKIYYLIFVLKHFWRANGKLLPVRHNRKSITSVKYKTDSTYCAKTTKSLFCTIYSHFYDYLFIYWYIYSRLCVCPRKNIIRIICIISRSIYLSFHLKLIWNREVFFKACLHKFCHWKDLTIQVIHLSYKFKPGSCSKYKKVLLLSTTLHLRGRDARLPKNLTESRKNITLCFTFKVTATLTCNRPTPKQKKLSSKKWQLSYEVWRI